MDDTQEKDEKYTRLKKSFLDAVFKPTIFESVIDKICNNNNPGNKKYLEYVTFWIDDLKNDTSTMERIIETYINNSVDDSKVGYVLAQSIGKIEGKDGSYFESLYGRLVEQLQGDTSYAGFTPVDKIQDKVKCGIKSHARVAAIKRVTNQDFLKKVVEEVPNDCYFAYQSPQAVAVLHINNQQFLEEILANKVDSFIVEAAISGLTNKTLLNHYAQKSDEECNLDKSAGARVVGLKEIQGFHNFINRKSAQRRLNELLTELTVS